MKRTFRSAPLPIPAVIVSGIGESVLRFTVLSPDAWDWIEANVHLEDWQRSAGGFAVEHRFAGALIDGLSTAGFRVRVE